MMTGMAGGEMGLELSRVSLSSRRRSVGTRSTLRS
jgi:hypothetical protein